MKPVVVFDLDGVLCDFTIGFSTLASKYFRVPIMAQHEQLHWKGLGGHLSPAEKEFVWSKVDEMDDFWENLPSLVTNQDRIAMHVLSDVATIKYVTNRQGPDNMEQQTERWLFNHSLPEGEVVRTSNKPKTVEGYMYPPNKLLGCIEDNPSNISGFARRGIPCIVRDWQYNREVEQQLARVTNISQFCKQMILQTNRSSVYASKT